MSDPFTADREELLELLLREEGLVDEPADSASADLSASTDVPSPQQGLSPTQQGLWLVEQISESTISAYNITASFLLDGPLLPGAMDACCREILRRHPVLRTRFELHGEAPLAVVDAMDRRQVVPLIDLSALEGEIGHGEAERLARSAAARPLDLAHEWALRASLLRLAERRHALLLAVHHMVADGRSFQIVLRELALLYRALYAGKAARMAPTAPLYDRLGDHWRRCSESSRLERQLSYWRRRLTGLRLLELPTDRPRPRRPDPTGLRLLRGLDGELGRALLRLAREERVTPFMLLLAAFQTLLGRIAGQDDVLVGTAADARDRFGVGEAVGLFLNTVVLRTDLSGRPSFRDLLTRVRRVTGEAFENSDLPFDRLVAELEPEREAGRNPLYQVLFGLGDDTETLALPELPELEVSSLSGHSGTAKVDLYVSILPGDPDWTVYAVLSRALFDATTVRRWLRGFEVLLRAVVEEPGRGVAELPVSTAAERHQVVREWSAGGAEPDAPEPEPVHELFTRVARGRPDRLAVESGRFRWSYAHLSRVTDRVAAHLVRLGTRPGDRVALLTERTPEMLAGLLGILRAGAAQVPLDPSHPPERLGSLLADAGVRVLLGETRLAEKLTRALPELGCAVLRLEPAVSAPEAESPLPPPRLDPSQAAYVIYTSGTTGRPKGTIVPHGALARLTRTAREDPAFAGYRRSLQFASISFDASVLEIYPCLTSGATLVLRDEEMIATAADLVDACERLRLTMIHPPTAYWHHLVPEMTRDGLRFPPVLRLFIMGGEAARTETWREWRRLGHEHVELVNVYGPTEATAISSRFRMGRGRPETRSVVSVGRPIANARFFVLDPVLRPMPFGAVGELAIAGAGLSWGYLGHGARTAASFVPDPFGERPGVRLYRTGDRVRWRGDGQLLFEGRRDRQLKLRGFRVEPGEIEAALARLPGVREAVVDVVVADRVAAEEAPNPGERRLVAWVIARPGHELSAEEIREALARELPPFMIPAAFVFPESLPRTAGGKIDRRALPAPSFEAGPPPGAESGRHPLREMVTTTWAEVLGLEHVDEHDEFFALGGHSLLAMRLIARLRELFRCEIPLADLFHHSTPAGFAAAVERRLRGEPEQAGAPLTAAGRSRTPLSFAQRRLWLVQQLDPDNTAFNNTGAVRLTGPLDVAALDRALRELVRRHQVLRTTFHEGEDGPFQLVGPVPDHGLARVDLCRLPAERREGAAHREILAAARRVHDLERGPLFRALLLVLGESDVFLLSSIHHIVDDAGSEEILLGELAVLYQAFAAGREPLLGELPVQYGDYALWQEQRLGGQLLDRLLTHWRDRLAGAAPAMTLPLDRPRPAVRGSAGDRELLRLPSERLETLRAFSRAEGVTLFMTILAAFKTALHHATEETDVLVGTNVAGRDRPGIEGLIGFFVNMVILRTDLSGDPSFRELLVRVRETALQAWAHQELPFERLVEELCPRRDPSLTPLVQVVVNFNQPGLLSPVPEFPGLTVERFETGRFPAHFDLILDVAAGDELACSLVYNTALFEASTVRRLLSRFEFLLDLAVRDPELSLSRLRKETEKAWREKLAARRGSFRKRRRSPKRGAP